MVYSFASLCSEKLRTTKTTVNHNAHSLAPSSKHSSYDKDKDRATFSLHCWDQKAAEGRGRVSLGL